MGNSQAKEARPGSSRGPSHHAGSRNPSSPTTSGPGAAPPNDRSNSGIYSSRNGRGSRHDLPFLGRGAPPEREATVEPRRETKAEREARKLEKERIVRAQERERSLREEGVDGGFLVTLGTYTGPEDFSKPVVRQLQIERRMAPFWKGLNDHSDMWTENQLVAVVNDLPLPPADEIPPEAPPRANNLSLEWNPRTSNPNINSLTVPMGSRTMSRDSDRSASLSPSHPAFSLPSPTSPIAASPSSSPFFRGRAKTLAALTSSSRNNSRGEMVPQEIELPKDPYVNGQRIEAFLYKNASECPICFLYYPPYLNKTRCCDQPICSECFVQIKRPDPHAPEHHDPTDPHAPTEPQEDGTLVSEPAACPFCVQPEFGITYDPPPFRRGLTYANKHGTIANAASAMSSTSSLNSQGLTSPGRRRATSLAVNDSSVITTDRVRPDWSKKLADARAHALRRAAAATALHNAAYMMGNLQAAETRGFGLGRRRRTLFGSNDSPGSSGHGTPRNGVEVNPLLAAGGGSSIRLDGQTDLLPGRLSSRRGNRLEDLEELMMMEAIRLSLAAEEERKKKEEKEAAKEAKKDEKKKAKEAKKADKFARKSGFYPAPNMDGENEASSSSASGKGKAVDRSETAVGFNPLNEPTSTLNTNPLKASPQRHLEQSRAEIQRQTSGVRDNQGGFDPFNDPNHRSALRNLSDASSSVSSLNNSVEESSLRNGSHGNFGASGSSFEASPNASGVSLNQDETPPHGTPGTEPMFNFRSLEAVMTKDNDAGGAQHIEDVTESSGTVPESSKNDEGAVFNAKPTTPEISVQPPAYTSSSNGMEGKSGGSAEDLAASATTLKPTKGIANEDEDDIEPAPRVEVVSNSNQHGIDAKHIGDLGMVDSLGQQHTQ